MKILVTGGAGFIASHIVDAYVESGHEVVVVDNLSTGKKEFLNKKARFYQADIRDREEVEKIVSGEKPEVINHHAAQISVRNSVDDPITDASINLIGLLNLLESGRKNGLKKFIFASSGGVVYGEAKILPTPENYCPLQPLSPYGVTKLASEYYLHFYYSAYKIFYIALRYSNVYGPRQNPHGEAGVVAIFSKKLLRNESPTINGDGLQTRDYIYVGDVVEANKLCLAAKAVGSFNIGTGKETNVNDVYNRLKKITQSQGVATHGPSKTGEQQRSCLNWKLVNKTLGFSPRFNLKDGLENTVSYFKTHE